MEILDKSEVQTSREGGNFGRNPDTPGMYEEWMLTNEVLPVLLEMEDNKAATVTVEEMGSSGETSNGCAYGINKICVAGCLPLKAASFGKKKVKILKTDAFNPMNYATDEYIEEKGTKNAYEQPSRAQIARVEKKLEELGYETDNE